MFEEMKTITAQEVAENGVCAAPDVLTGTSEENKKVFDRLSIEVLIPKINEIIKEAKNLQKLSEDNTKVSEELEEYIKDFEEQVGDISSMTFKGDSLCEKIMTFFNAISSSFLNLESRVGTLDNLRFFTSSIVNAINYVYDFFYESKIYFSPSLPQASFENYKKIYRVFDVKTNSTRYYICKASLPNSTGLYLGKTVDTLYFDPNINVESYITYRENYYEFFESFPYPTEKATLVSFVRDSDPEDIVNLQVRYSISVDGFSLVYEKDGMIAPLWGSKAFSSGGVTYTKGYNHGPSTNRFSGYTVTGINGNLIWLLNTSEFPMEYYWEEIFTPYIDVSVDKTGKNHLLRITKGDKTQSFTIRDGINGYTPVKGQDYFTQSDIDEISTAIEEELRGEIVSKAGIVPEFVSSEEECTDETKLYVLPDGYIYTCSESLVAVAENMFNYGNGAKLNYRLSTASIETPQNGIVLLDFVDVELSSPYLVKISGTTLSNVCDFTIHVTAFNENKTRIGAALKYPAEVQYSNGVYTIDLYEMLGESCPSAKYVRLAFGIRDEELFADDEDVASIFVDFVPKNTYEQRKVLTNTNHTFSSIDYGDEIKELYDVTSDNSDRIYELEQNIENAGLVKSYVPSCWDGAVLEVISKIKEKQREFGINGITFAFFSDNHMRIGYSGPLIWEVMKECNIPYAFFGGDAISNGTIESKALMETQEKYFYDMVKCIPAERFHRALGNHDGYYLTSDGRKYNCPWDEKHFMFLSPLTVSSNRVFGENGTYYYVDHTASKTRFIVLNSVWFDYQTNEDGTVNNSDGAGFGNEQLNWLCNTLSSIPDGYHVVFLSHSPVSNNAHTSIRDIDLAQGVVNAFIEGKSFSGEYTQSQNSANNSAVNVSFEKKGNVIGWFSGHIHRDLITSVDEKSGNELLFKVVTITSDANMSYDETEPERNMDGDTSHAIDFVTVNKKTGEVSIFRLGIGNDRTYNYLEE